jgi:hypothetical protein
LDAIGLASLAQLPKSKGSKWSSGSKRVVKYRRGSSTEASATGLSSVASTGDETRSLTSNEGGEMKHSQRKYQYSDFVHLQRHVPSKETSRSRNRPQLSSREPSSSVSPRSLYDEGSVGGREVPPPALREPNPLLAGGASAPGEIPTSAHAAVAAGSGARGGNRDGSKHRPVSFWVALDPAAALAEAAKSAAAASARSHGMLHEDASVFPRPNYEYGGGQNIAAGNAAAAVATMNVRARSRNTSPAGGVSVAVTRSELPKFEAGGRTSPATMTATRQTWKQQFQPPPQQQQPPQQPPPPQLQQQQQRGETGGGGGGGHRQSPPRVVVRAQNRPTAWELSLRDNAHQGQRGSPGPHRAVGKGGMSGSAPPPQGSLHTNMAGMNLVQLPGENAGQYPGRKWDGWTDLAASPYRV